MNAENLDKLIETLYRKGFGEGLNEELKAKMLSGSPEFILEHMTTIGKDEVGYRLHFRRDDDPEKDKVYFNNYDAAIFKNADAPGEVREHNFPADKMITAMEAYRMLKHGDLVAVNKNLFNKEGNQYNTWISIDIEGEKDERGNYPVNTYHENYYKKQPFVIGEALKNLPVPVKELGNPQTVANIEKALQKANLVEVIIKLNGAETNAFLSVNPAKGRIDLYDQNLQLIEGQQQETKQDVGKTNSQAQSQDEVKKKPWGNQQQVKWDKKSPSKGVSR